MEERHQRLHNRTTPDDVVICQAQIEYIQSHGTTTISGSTFQRWSHCWAMPTSGQQPMQLNVLGHAPAATRPLKVLLSG